MMRNWQKFKDEFCGGCMHYFYTNGKKVFKDQQKVCWKQGGECKKLLKAVVIEAHK